MTRVYNKELRLDELIDHASVIFVVESLADKPSHLKIKDSSGKEFEVPALKVKVIEVLKTYDGSSNGGYTFTENPLGQGNTTVPSSLKKGDAITIMDRKPMESPVPPNKSYEKVSFSFMSTKVSGKHIFFGNQLQSDLATYPGALDFGLVSMEVLKDLRQSLVVRRYFDAIRSQKIEQLEAVIAKEKAHINDVDPTWGSPMHFAARYGSVADLELLLKNGAKLETRNSKGDPVLHDLVSSGFKDNLGWVIKNSKNLTLKNTSGHTALDLAIKSNDDKATKLLKSR